ncbi:membrane protein YeiH [Klebsiella pneumoniae]|uniref:Membrane protein YeiH n=1 Tax=Klebsiella pneumoniae TaxID=573 RepID=A0A378AML7_KLEPN|nr:membrane protein YeiH [Klebsiella pneumoniae]
MFILVAVFNSFHLLPKAVVDMLVTLDTVLLAMAMAALGVTTHVSALKKSRGETAADGADAVRLVDCRRRGH